MKTNKRLEKGLKRQKKNKPNGSFQTQAVSKWYPDKGRVVEIRQEWNLNFGT
jgi:hypothetical protein